MSLEEAKADLLARRNSQRKLEEIDAELSLYDPTGPWSLFEKRLRAHEARAKVGLETGPVEEVLTQRKILALIRDLLGVPERLRQERELLVKDLDNA